MKRTFAFYVSKGGRGKPIPVPTEGPFGAKYMQLMVRVVEAVDARDDLEALHAAPPPEPGEQFMNTHTFEFD